MKILFLGGTKFVGRKMVEDALAAGHEVSLMQRGITNADLFDNVKKYIGNRNEIDNILPHNEHWDIVIDTCGYHPGSVKISTEFLRHQAKRYIFISTASVYASFSKPGLNENSALAEIENIPPLDEKITNINYGPLKVLCEKEVIQTFGVNRSLILRPTIIVGSYDNTNRFDYWLKAIKTQNHLEVPNNPNAFIQFIDIRALSRFTLDACAKSISGIYNVIGPKQSLKFLDFINTAKNLLNPTLDIQYSLDDSKEYPMYVKDKEHQCLFQINGDKAYRAGLNDISVENTIKTTAQNLQN